MGSLPLAGQDRPQGRGQRAARAGELGAMLERKLAQHRFALRRQANADLPPVAFRAITPDQPWKPGAGISVETRGALDRVDARAASEQRSPRQRPDRRSLRQTAEQFGVLTDELVNRREKWR